LVRRVTAPPATVITVGAGASPIVGALLADGHRVVAVDIAAAALDALARDLPDAEAARQDGRLQLLDADVRTLRLGTSVDVWHDRAVFHFMAADDQRMYVDAATRAVRSGGHLVIATFAPDGPTSCSGLPVTRHDASSLSAAFAGGFELIDSFEADHVTPWATSQRFTHALLRRT